MSKKKIIILGLLVTVLIVCCLMIIGLSLIVTSGMSLAQRNMRDTQRKSTAQQLTMLLETYNLDNGEYPAELIFTDQSISMDGCKNAECIIDLSRDEGIILPSEEARIGGARKTVGSTRENMTKWCYSRTADGYVLVVELENGTDYKLGFSDLSCEDLESGEYQEYTGSKPLAPIVTNTPDVLDNPGQTTFKPFSGLGKFATTGGEVSPGDVVVIEYTDFECPFCRRHHQQTLDEIKKNYVDNGGKINYIIMDFPLSFHEPAATNAAVYAECVYRDAGSLGYFVFVDKYFDYSIGNGQGITQANLSKALKETPGVNSDSVMNCYSSEGASIKADIATETGLGKLVGITGTPGFLVGIVNDDMSVTGELINGAVPYTNFESVINKYL